jgi:hypothetical protein
MCVLFLGCGCSDATHKGVGTEDLSAAKRLDAPLAGYVDAVNGIAMQPNHIFAVSPGTRAIEVKGWAVDTAAGKPGLTMALLVENRLIRCKYGEERPDVGAALHNENYRYSGYTCQIAESVFNASRTTFEPILMTGSGSYYVGPKVVVKVWP